MSWSLCLSWAMWPQASPRDPSSAPHRAAQQQDRHHQQFHQPHHLAPRARRSPPSAAWPHRAQPPHARPRPRRHPPRHQHQRPRQWASQIARTQATRLSTRRRHRLRPHQATMRRRKADNRPHHRLGQHPADTRRRRACLLRTRRPRRRRVRRRARPCHLRSRRRPPRPQYRPRLPGHRRCRRPPRAPARRGFRTASPSPSGLLMFTKKWSE